MTVPERFFLDSNVLVYAFDQRAEKKQHLARAWLDRLWANATGSVSWQVMHEFYWIATRKLNLPEAFTRGWVEQFLLWDPVDTSASLIQQAWYWIDAAHIAFWDALIVAAAEASRARVLLSEDMQAGRAFGGVRVVDPFGEEGGKLLKTLS